MNKLKNPLRALAFALGTTLVGTATAQVAVIVNPKSPTASMTANQVANLFLGKSGALPSGAAAVMVDQPEGSALNEQFYGKVAGRTGAQVRAAWSRLTFSGKATPPRVLANTAEVKKFVAANPDAIGYIDKSALDGTVKAVLTVD